MKARLVKVGMWIMASILGILAVLYVPNIACSFMTVAPTEMVDEPGMKVLVGFLAFSASQVLLANLAEVAVIVTVLAIYSTLDWWKGKVEARWTPTAEVACAT